MNKFSIGRNFLVTMIVLSAFLMGCVFIFAVKPLPGNDFGRYQRLGYNLAWGYGYSEESTPPYTPAAVRMPMYPLFSATIYKFFGFNDTVVFLWQALLYALTALFLYLTARELFSEQVALFSGFLFALYPISSYWVGVLYTETLATYLLIMVTFFSVKYLKYKKIDYLCWMGICTGMLVLTRPVFGLYPLAILFCFLLLRLPLRKLILHSFLVIFLVAAVMSPWIVRNYIVYRQFIPLIKGYGVGISFYLSTMQFKGNWHGVNHRATPEFQSQIREMLSQGNFSTGPERFPLDPDASPICWRYGIRNVLDDPLNYLLSFVKKFPRLYMPAHNPSFSNAVVILSAIASAAVLLLGIIGIWMVKDRWRQLIFLFLPLAYVTGIHMFLFTNSRYTIPVRPQLMVFVALALTKLFFKGRVLLNVHKQ